MTFFGLKFSEAGFKITILGLVCSWEQEEDGMFLKVNRENPRIVEPKDKELAALQQIQNFAEGWIKVWKWMGNWLWKIFVFLWVVFWITFANLWGWVLGIAIIAAIVAFPYYLIQYVSCMLIAKREDWDL